MHKLVAIAAMVFVVQFAGHAGYVHFAEFLPAAREFDVASDEWFAAHARRDFAARNEAWRKEMAIRARETEIMGRTFDPIWFVRN